MRKNLVALVLFSIIVGLIPTGCGGGSREPSVEEGQKIFDENCSECHNTTRIKKVGPGLRNLMKRANPLPNKMYPSVESVTLFLIKGAGEHPVFTDMLEGDMDDLLEFLKTL